MSLSDRLVKPSWLHYDERTREETSFLASPKLKGVYGLYNQAVGYMIDFYPYDATADQFRSYVTH